MVKQKVVLKNLTGLDLRPVGILCDAAVQFQSKISIYFANGSTNAKSILGVLGSGIKNGDEIELVCEGSDEEEALERMLKIIEEGLGE